MYLSLPPEELCYCERLSTPFAVLVLCDALLFPAKAPPQDSEKRLHNNIIITTQGIQTIRNVHIIIIYIYSRCKFYCSNFTCA